MILEFTAGTQAAIDLPLVLDLDGTRKTGLGLSDFSIDLWDGTGTLVYARDQADSSPDTYDTDKVTVEWAELGSGAYQIRVNFANAAVGLLGRAAISETTYGMPAVDYSIRVYSSAVAVAASDASYITGLRTRGIASTELDDTAATAIIQEGVYDFSRYRPIIADREFDTIADQLRYTPAEMGDSELLTVILCLWNPYQTGDEWDLARTLATLGVPREAGYWHLPSQQMLEDIKGAQWAQTYGGSGYQIDTEGGDLFLDPMPDEAGESVKIIYTKPHSSTATIVSSDRDIFLDLLEAMAAQRIANEIAKKSSAMRVRTPEYELETGAQVRYWRERGQTARHSFIGKCQAGYAACGRT